MTAHPLPILLVDARNVQRSTWPNPDVAVLLDALAGWAGGPGREEVARIVAVFDGAARAADAAGSGCAGALEVVWTPYADDELVSRAVAATAAGARVAAVTSDRELRERLVDAGATIRCGGGHYLSELGLRRPRGGQAQRMPTTDDRGAR